MVSAVELKKDVKKGFKQIDFLVRLWHPVAPNIYIYFRFFNYHAKVRSLAFILR